MTSAIKDNRTRGKVGDFLKDCIKDGSTLSFVSAYFTIYAYDKLKDKLNRIDHLNFLFGEPRFVKNLDPERTDKKAFSIVNEKLALGNQLQQKCLAKECHEWITVKVDIRTIKQANLLHGKMYHIDDEGRKKALVGSSNFTVSGMGFGANPNIELNLEVDSDRDRAELKVWFDEIWNNQELVKDVKQDVLTYLAQLYADHPPQFIYFKTLFHLFYHKILEQDQGGLFDETSHIKDTKIWKMLFDFQRKGVISAINKIEAHNGCIIADSVGLGKTFEALAVIKYFELRKSNVLVLCPKKLRENWTNYLATSDMNPLIEDRFRFTVLSHTDLSRDSGIVGNENLATIAWDRFDLVVIDESHNFRNNSKGKKDEDGNVIRKSRYERLMEDIVKGREQSDIRTKVLMLSATPVNNNLTDLRNQLSFVTGGDDNAFSDSLGINSLGDTLVSAQRTFTTWAHQGKDRDVMKLQEKLDSAFFKLLDALTIARSRKQIQRFYAKDMQTIGEFPGRKAIPVYPNIDLAKKFMTYDQLNEEIQNYQLSLFKPSMYVQEEFKAIYEKDETKNFSQEKREGFLIGMMKVNFLKRLESSVHSFATSMSRTIEKIKALQAKIRAFQSLPDDTEIDPDELHSQEGDDEETEDAWQVGKKVPYRLKHMNCAEWLEALEKDRLQLEKLYKAAAEVTVERDEKLSMLKQIIEQKVRRPNTDKDGALNRKILVFTAFADTAAYLYDALHVWAKDELKAHTALVTGGGENHTTFGNSDYTTILTNFSPRSKQRAKMASMAKLVDEIDILIATDCISEGQNLQDCDTLVNYDIHWNPVRIIQRFGRIDRIGSRNPMVHLVNFWPTKDLDNYISLKDRVEARMALVDMTATADDNLLQDDNIQELIAEDLNYRNRQLKKMQNEVLDMEDVSDGASLSDFTLDDFIMELMGYLEANRKALEDAPNGLYAVVPAPAGHAIIQPGVIFCLEQRLDEDKKLAVAEQKVNPLQPYFLVYVRDDGEVRYNFTHAKQVLEMFRILAGGCVEPLDALCTLFNQETKEGADMSRYDDLVKKAVAEIRGRFVQRNLKQGLQGGREGKLVGSARQVEGVDSFDLITWLVIKEQQ
jgi:superfamily II DNA or RNA helicase